MKIKKCYKCGKNKPLTEYYKCKKRKDGHRAGCKECSNKTLAALKKKPRKKRQKLDPEARLAQKRLAQKRRDEKRKLLYPERIKAKNAIAVALTWGRIERKPCQICGGTGKVQGHHEDYNRPIEVTWLCPSCHSLWHQILREWKRQETAQLDKRRAVMST